MDIKRKDPKMKVVRTFGDKHQTFNEVAQMDLPEEYMDKYKELIGDAQAHISVSSDMGIKDFGTGAGAMVTVSLTCNQDAVSIEKAIDFAGVIARQFASEHQQLADIELKKIIDAKKASYP